MDAYMKMALSATGMISIRNRKNETIIVQLLNAKKDICSVHNNVHTVKSRTVACLS